MDISLSTSKNILEK